MSLPTNPTWPADYVNWGEEGWRVEFQRCICDFDDHLRTFYFDACGFEPTNAGLIAL